MVFLEVRVRLALHLPLERRKGAHHRHETLALQCFLEAVEVLLSQIGDLPCDEHHHGQPRVFLEQDVHLQHQVAHLRSVQKHHAHLLLQRLLQLALTFGGKYFALDLPQTCLQQLQEMSEFLFLVLADLDWKYLSLHPLAVLAMTHTQQVLHCFLQALFHQFVLQLLAGLDD